MTDRPDFRIVDLGELDGEVLIFGGPYSNLEATRALLAEAGRRGIPGERLICTGDVVAYCADPEATVAEVRAAGAQVVMGNCEENLGRGAEDCGCGFAEGSACDLLSASWYAFASAALSPVARRWMTGLPRHIRFAVNGHRLTAIHGGVDRINRFIFASESAESLSAELARAGGDGIVAGHSGLPFGHILDGRLWLNAGVIGQPANDGTPRVWYSLIRPAGAGVEIEIRPLDYDHRAAAAKMAERGLPAAYAGTLTDGLWPNDDVLPPAEIAARGRPRRPIRLAWTRQAPASAAD